MIDWLATAMSLINIRKRRCPVCRRRAASFNPLPSDYHDQAIKHGYRFFGEGETINVDEYSCPHCGASDRERLYALFLDEIVNDPDFIHGASLLHFAPEVALSRFIRSLDKFEYRTADIAMDGVNDKVDITSMSLYDDATFDAFICSHVLEHVQDDHAAMCELRRILKPGGWGILMVPLMTQFDESIEDPCATTDADRWRLFGQGDHVRLYAKQDFLRRIARSGFSVRRYGVDYFGSDTFSQCGITPSSTLYVVGHD